MEIMKNKKSVFNYLSCTLLQRCNIAKMDDMYKFYQSFNPINCN